MSKVQTIKTEALSFYRTKHRFEAYAEFSSIEEFKGYCDWARERNLPIYILGNGSNTFFCRRNIKSLVLKNNLPKKIEVISENKIRTSSSTTTMEVLKYCYHNSLNSFYYLASVPATIGGALAMNAGRGKAHNLSIYDYVENVSFFDAKDKEVKTLNKSEIVKGYRTTVFTGVQSSLILEATLKFEATVFASNPITERCKWSKQNQDYSAPNCGSVFKDSDSQILSRLMDFKLGKSSFSGKTKNWILNHSKSHVDVLILIRIAQALHYFKRKKALPEIILVK